MMAAKQEVEILGTIADSDAVPNDTKYRSNRVVLAAMLPTATVIIEQMSNVCIDLCNFLYACRVYVYFTKCVYTLFTVAFPLSSASNIRQCFFDKNRPN